MRLTTPAAMPVSLLRRAFPSIQRCPPVLPGGVVVISSSFVAIVVIVREERTAPSLVRFNPSEMLNLGRGRPFNLSTSPLSLPFCFSPQNPS
jgi:hypothetical protein